MKTATAPSLSVLLLCWNQARFLNTCFESLSVQSNKDFEVIFLDNCSTDGSFEKASELIDRLGIKSTRLHNKHPQRIGTNLNRMEQVARAPLLSFLAADDWWAPAYVEEMTKAAEKHPKDGLFYAGGWTFDESDQRTERIDSSKHLSGNVLSPLLKGASPIFFVGTTVRRAAFAAAGGFDEKLQIEDLDFFIQLALRTTFRRVDAPLVTYRKSDKAISADAHFMVAGWEEYHRKYRGSEFWDVDRWMAEMYRSYAATSIDRGDYRFASALLLKSLRIRPAAGKSYRTASYLLRRATTSILLRKKA